MPLASPPRQGALAAGRALQRHTELGLWQRNSNTAALHVFEADKRARRLNTNAGHAPDRSTRVEPEYEAAEVPLLKRLP
jgi:hypothetical protein